MALSPRRVTVLGGSGLVGRALTDLPADPRLQQHRFDPHNTDDWQHRLSVDAVFCCLGTTIKIAGSQSAFRAVDYDLVVRAAEAAKQAGARHFLVISALGADARSRVFYNRVKGEMETALQTMGLAKLSIFRPSLLAGPRQEFRLGEKLGLVLGSWLPLAWRPIRDQVVAGAMCWASQHQVEAVRTYSSADMQRLAQHGQRVPT